MNKRQRMVLVGTAAIVAIMVLFPPYVARNHSQVVIKSTYGFLFAPPAYESGDRKVSIPATVNVTTLSAQIVATLVVGGLCYLALRDGKRLPTPDAGDSKRNRRLVAPIF